MKKLKSNLIMFIILIAYFAIVILIFYKTYPSNIALVVGIPISLVYSFMCFFNKRIRSKMTIWWGILSFLSCVWWIYLMTK
jgi:hypothetical protein